MKFDVMSTKINYSHNRNNRKETMKYLEGTHFSQSWRYFSSFLSSNRTERSRQQHYWHSTKAKDKRFKEKKEEKKKKKRRPKFMTTAKQPEQQSTDLQTMMCLKKKPAVMETSPLLDEEKEEEVTRSALAAFRAKEDEIERRRSEIRDRVQAQLSRVEEEAKRLQLIHGELESVTDPMKKEVAVICKRVELINRDVKLLGASCQKKEKEYKESAEAFNEKSKEKGLLLAKLKELVTESEKLRSTKLEEICKNI